MRVFTFLILTFYFLLLVTGCKNNINSGFTYEGHLFEGLEVSFKSNETNGTYYLWEFGNGETALGPNPRHRLPNLGGKFPQPGNRTPVAYEVTLTIIDRHGNAHTHSETLMVQKTPEIIKIKSLTLLDTDYTRQIMSQEWNTDPNGPDLYHLIIGKYGSSASIEHNVASSSIKADVKNLPITWTYPTPIEIKDLNDFHCVRIADANSPQSLGISATLLDESGYTLSESFVPYSSNKIILNSLIELEVEYEFFF